VAATYSGFNLLLCDADGLLYASNRATPFVRSLAPGIYGLSNHLLDTPWPKLTRVRRQFAAWVAAPEAPQEQLLSMLADRTPASPAPNAETTGFTREWERALSAPFVLHPKYGTRCSTIVLLGSAGELSVWERRFDTQGEVSGESRVTLAPDEWL
jgi:uncharacterized protein with NRDE domain